MRNVHIDYQGSDLNFQSASEMAKEVAKQNQMQDPTIMAWHKNADQPIPPVYDGADPETWWAKYGSGNGGRLEVCVGDDYQFIMMDARGFEELGEMPLRNLSDDQGNQYLCITPSLGKSASRPDPDTCTQLDGWAADQY
jgi:hypothetical protein